MSVIVKALTALEMQRMLTLIYFLFAYQQWIRTHRRGQYLRREDAFSTSPMPLLYSLCKRLLTTLTSFNLALAVTIGMNVEDAVDALAKNAVLGCSATTTNCNITHST
ncbi:unnamed protein product [Taenia asiatica]|uniref:Secreted protein n=1 Tax=Taenia asiatica TaxID=60517 RepID=A0A0R3WGT9_TAEAS|nr:unnamed protein product [Taenia asiatica]